MDLHANSSSGQIGLDYHEDPFLYRVVELTAVMKLRDIKYRGRIPVPDGVTLYGVTDETGSLREGEIYVVRHPQALGVAFALANIELCLPCHRPWRRLRRADTVSSSRTTSS